MAREAVSDGDSPSSLGDELDLVADIIRLRLRDGETMNDDDDDAISSSSMNANCHARHIRSQTAIHSKWYFRGSALG
jgi:hypothetical protein